MALNGELILWAVSGHGHVGCGTE